MISRESVYGRCHTEDDSDDQINHRIHTKRAHNSRMTKTETPRECQLKGDDVTCILIA